MHFTIQTMMLCKVFPRTFKALGVAAVLAALLSPANADRILYDSFEVANSNGDPVDWETEGHPSYLGVATENSTWTTPYGNSGMSTYSNGIGTRTITFLPNEAGDYILKFNISSSAAKGEYRAELWVDHPFFGRSLLAFVAGDTDGSKNMSFSNQITWRHDPAVNFLDGAELEIKLMQDPNRSDWRNTPIWDNVSVDWDPDVDTSGPTVSDITHGIDGLIVGINALVTYTVTFNEPMNPATVNTSDFGNAGSSPATIESVTPDSNNTVFLVGARPTNAGTLRLRINAGATLTDALGNAMNTVTAIEDTSTINVDATNPILMPSDIVDDKNGGPIQANSPVTYTLTFNQDINSSSVSAADFGNAGTAPIMIGSITETTPTSGVFTVQVTPTSSGTLQFRVNQNVLISGTAGGTLNTNPEIVDDTTLIVDSTSPTLTAILDNLPELDEFADPDDASAGPVTVGTLIVYDVIFSEDMNHTTVTAADFGNAVTVGAAPFTINLVQEGDLGIFRVEVTPTGAGTIQLQVNAGAVLTDAIGNALATSSALVDNTTITVEGSNPYAAWSGGAAFDADSNSDGVKNGLAWLLGAGSTSVNSIARLPVTNQSGGNLTLTFTCLKVANRGGAVLKVQYSRDLGITDAWHDAVVPDSTGIVNSVTFSTSANADPALINVQATIPASAATPGTKLFARLSGVSAP